MKFMLSATSKASVIALLKLFCVFFTVALLGAQENVEPVKSAIKKIDANIVFMRHAIAPGFGDPIDFKIGDCSTQRNLDQAGQLQAQRIGEYMLTNGLEFDEVLSSEWCRCGETARLLDLGEWQAFSGLNSFFQSHADKQETLTKLESYLGDNNHGLSLLVTHQVVIGAITGHSVESGGLVVYNSTTGQALPVRVDYIGK
ncbi:histidine phosphatase family protein [Reinekea forsetii]|nr:histidine phosphatase family protein [Reinekea forsetii]